MGTAEKTSVSDDFKRLDLETSSRKEGIEKLTIALTDYAKTLDKRSSLDKKISALNMWAKSLIQQGKFHGDESRLGLVLSRVGDIQDKIQRFQEDFVAFSSQTGY